MVSRKFLGFKVYQDAKLLHRRVVFLTKKFPQDFWYLKNQMRRSSLSIILAIAEGSAKSSKKDFARYLQIAMGSSSETMAGFDVACEESLVSRQEFLDLFKLCDEISNQLGGFEKALRKS